MPASIGAGNVGLVTTATRRTSNDGPRHGRRSGARRRPRIMRDDACSHRRPADGRHQFRVRVRGEVCLSEAAVRLAARASNMRRACPFDGPAGRQLGPTADCCGEPVSGRHLRVGHACSHLATKPPAFQPEFTTGSRAPRSGATRATGSSSKTDRRSGRHRGRLAIAGRDLAHPALSCRRNCQNHGGRRMTLLPLPDARLPRRWPRTGYQLKDTTLARQAGSV